MIDIRSILIATATLAVALGVAALFEIALFNRGPQPDDNTFADRLDLRDFGHLAVQSSGRLKSLDSFASAVMQEITGPHRLGGRTHTHAYLDLMFRPGEYVETPVIYVGKKPVRERLARAVLESLPADLQEMERAWADEFLATGLISEQRLQHPAIRAELAVMRSDLIRTARFVGDIEFAQRQMRFETLLAGLAMVPPAGRGETVPWMTIDEYGALDPATHPLDADLRLNIRAAWQRFAIGWLERDADEVNAAAADLTDLLPRVNPVLYPQGRRAGWPWSLDREDVAGWTVSALIVGACLGWMIVGLRRGRRTAAALGAVAGLAIIALHAAAAFLGRFNPLELESFYFLNYHRINDIWIIYLFSAVFALMAIVYRWNWARVSGLTLFLLAFALHSAALLLRWYVSDRWPNTNMFEAVTTAAWFGGCGAIVLESLTRRTNMRNLFALGSAVASMTAFMAAHFLPQYLNAAITNKMPVLDDIWLYIHTNVIIFSYVLIFMAGVVALVYLAYRLALAWMGDRLEADGPYHAAAGAGSMMSGESVIAALETPALNRRAAFCQVLDGATMILVEVSFVLLWAGIVMGAIWADHSWGRPWGWDPKEVFALNTFIIFAVLIHTRLKARDKGLWTAMLTILGVIVMLFNWIFINFKISGLHSYA